MRRQAAGLVATRGMASLLQTLVLVLYARTVSTEDFGFVSAVLGVCAFISSFSDFGVSVFAMKAAAIDNDWDRLSTAMTVARYSSIVFAVLSTTALAVWAHFANHPASLCLIGLWAGLDKLCECLLSPFTVLRQVLPQAVSLLIRRAVPLVIFIVLKEFEIDASLCLGISLVVGLCAGAVHMEWLLEKRKTLSQVRVSRGEVLSLIRASRPYLATGGASQIRNLDTTVVAAVASASAAGGYAAAVRLTFPVFLVSAGVATAVVPAMAGRVQFVARKLRRLSVLIFVVSIVFLLLIGREVGDWILGEVFGDSYAELGKVFALVGVATISAALTSPLTAVAQAIGRARKVARVQVVFSVVLLVAIMGGALVGEGEGAALGAAVVQVVCFCAVLSCTLPPRQPREVT